jgi:predicted nucleotidyltransferase
MSAEIGSAVGLSDATLRLLRAVFARYPQVSEAWVYGSRAMGTYRPESDIDIALYGDVDELLAARIAGELEELPLPHTFDVQAYPCVRHQPLREHIDRVRRPVFLRDQSLSTGAP